MVVKRMKFVTARTAAIPNPGRTHIADRLLFVDLEVGTCIDPVSFSQLPDGDRTQGGVPV